MSGAPYSGLAPPDKVPRVFLWRPMRARAVTRPGVAAGTAARVSMGASDVGPYLASGRPVL